jgi:TonB family protein
MIALLMLLGSGLAHAQQTTPPTDTLKPDYQSSAKKINPPRPLIQAEAHYSDEARKKRINGLCVVGLIVDARGNPQNIRIERCTDQVFEKSSLDAVAKYQFSPATTQEGTPVPVKIAVEVEYRLYSRNDWDKLLRYNFNPLPEITSAEPGADGVYPLTKEATPPTVTKFADKGFGAATFDAKGESTCDIVLTIDVQGKAFDPQVTHCDSPALEKPAVQSLLKSKYKPGSVNGKAVPIRASIHLEYADAPAKP